MSVSIASRPWLTRPAVPMICGALGLAALAVRLATLDAIPLDSREARLAVAAAHRALGETAEPWLAGDGRLLPHAMILVFWLFGASDAAARIVPALAGAVASIAPLMLLPILGLRAATAAAAILVFSPIGIESSRLADPSALSGALTICAACVGLRVTSDRPSWAPWALAGTLGLAATHEPAALIGIAATGPAALAAVGFGDWPKEAWGERARWALGAASGPALLAASLALLVATGGLLDPRGVGYLFGDLWGALPGAVMPAGLSVRNALGLVAYAGPIALLALGELARSVRDRDRFDWFLGTWAALLLALGLTTGVGGLSFILLPTFPLALLAGRFVARFPSRPRSYELTAGGWAAFVLTAAVFVAAVALIADSAGNGRAPQGPKLAMGFLVVAASIVSWVQARRDGKHWPSAALLLMTLYVAWCSGAIGRLSVGGSPPGTEPLRLEETASGFRDIFHELTIVASAGNRGLVIQTRPSSVGDWYGRGYVVSAASALPPGGGIVVRPAQEPRPDGAPPGAARRLPWRVRSTIRSADLHPLGIARWLISRQGLFDVQMDDVQVTR